MQRPLPKPNMFRFADQALHQDEFTDSPANGFDRLFADATAAAVYQRHVWRETGTRFKSHLPELGAKQAVQHRQSDNAVFAEQYQRIATLLIGEAEDTIEHDRERRHPNARRGGARFGNNALRHVIELTEILQRDMQSRRCLRFAAESMLATVSACDLGNTGRRQRVGKNREKQTTFFWRRRHRIRSIEMP